MSNIVEKLKNPKLHHEAITEFLNERIIPEAVARVNEFFATKQLAKLSREVEPLPLEPRQFSAYRTRLGIILEYGMSTQIQYVLRQLISEEFLLTFVVSNEYPDFYLRDENLSIILKIEMKSVDADSDEQAASFDVLSSDIDPFRDYILYVGWEWMNEVLPNGELWEHPHIFSQIILPAIDIAEERDRRLYQTGGKIENGKVLVPSTKNPGSFSEDPGNYGKFWRIISRSRRNSGELSRQINKFVQFQIEVNKRAPRNRL